jgi:hypothetical protein
MDATEIVEGRNQLAASQVATGTEDHQRTRIAFGQSGAL